MSENYKKNHHEFENYISVKIKGISCRAVYGTHMYGAVIPTFSHRKLMNYAPIPLFRDNNKVGISSMRGR